MPSAPLLLLSILAVTPTPTPTPEFDETVITPGPQGFLAIALVTIAVVLLIIDMVRRIRRVRYRAEVREEIALEQEAALRDEELGEGSPADGGSDPDRTDPDAPRA